MTTTTFTTWKGLSDYCFQETGFKPFSGAGICPRGDSTCILRSVDGTYYYDDNLENQSNPEYTLFGSVGDQDLTDKRFNQKLLNAKHIYLYRKTKDKGYVWYGKYKRDDYFCKNHCDKNQQIRKIYILQLSQICDKKNDLM